MTKLAPGWVRTNYPESQHATAGLRRPPVRHMEQTSISSLYGGGGWGVERDNISDIRPPKKSNIGYQTPKKNQISHVRKNQISGLKNQISDIRPPKKSIIRNFIVIVPISHV